MKYKMFAIVAALSICTYGCGESETCLDHCDSSSSNGQKPNPSKPGVDGENADGSQNGNSGSNGSGSNEAGGSENGGSGEGTPGSSTQLLNPGDIAPWLDFYDCDDSDEPFCDMDNTDQYYVRCQNGRYVVQEKCSGGKNTCLDGKGCAVCQPDKSFCKGNDVYTCSSDGQSEILQQACGLNSCLNGICQDGNCPLESQFIYLVDSSYNMLQFNPGDTTGEPLKKLFSLRNICGASSSTPFSMAVDREANAWVLYNDSSLYKISIKSQVCTPITKFTSNGSGLSKFGMAFSLDAVGGNTDTLYIGDTATYGSFGVIDTDTMSYQKLAKFPSNYEQTPELTGTGLAKLFAFSPGRYEQHISEIDKSTGNVIKDILIEGAGGEINAWAFAHWGGAYFMFETVSGVNKILRYSPTTDETTVFLSSTPYKVVGAGVSTCAPIQPIN